MRHLALFVMEARASLVVVHRRNSLFEATIGTRVVGKACSGCRVADVSTLYRCRIRGQRERHWYLVVSAMRTAGLGSKSPHLELYIAMILEPLERSRESPDEDLGR